MGRGLVTWVVWWHVASQELGKRWPAHLGLLRQSQPFLPLVLSPRSGQ